MNDNTPDPPGSYRATVRPGESFPFTREETPVNPDHRHYRPTPSAAESAPPSVLAPPAPAADPADDRCRTCDGSGLVDDPPSRVLATCVPCEGTGKQSVAPAPTPVEAP